MVASSPLQTAVRDWQRRTATAASFGIPSSKIAPLQQYDLQRVESGSSPMTNQEVEAALNAQLYGANAAAQHPKTGITDIPGNVSSDVGGIISGFIPGTINFLHHLPSEVSKLGTDLAHPTLQSLTHDPILSLIPGVYDVGQLATQSGRNWMETHPVSSLLDILPLAGSAGKLAMAGRVTEAGTAAEALARGSVIKAGIRSGADTLSAGAERLLSRPIDLRKTFNQHLMNLGLHPQVREMLARPYEQMNRAGQAEMLHTYKIQIEPLFKGIGDTERADLWKEATLGFGKSTNPVHQHILDQVRNYNQLLFARGEQGKSLYGIIVPGGHRAIYTYDHPVSVAHRKFTTAQLMLDKSRANLARAKQPHVIQKRIDDLMKRQVKVTETETAYNETLRDNPDAAFMPAITQAIRSKVADEVRTGNVLASAEITSEVYDRIMGVGKQPPATEAFFKSLIGKDEFEAIYSDSKRMWLDLAKAGHSPIWVKKVTTDQTERTMFPKPLTHTVTPGQHKRRVLSFAPGLEDISAGMSEAASELIRQKGTDAILDHVAKTFGTDLESLRQEYSREHQLSKASKRRPDIQPHPELVDHMIYREWENFSETGIPMSASVRKNNPGQILIPKGVARSLRLMQGGYRMFGRDVEGGLLGYNGYWDKGLHLFRFSVLTGPRHLVHVGIGGLAFMTLRNPTALSKLFDGYNLIKSGKAPNALLGGVHSYSSDQVWNHKVGSHLGGLWKSVATKGTTWHQAYMNFESKIASTQRAAVYLDQVGKGVSVEEAMQEAYKTFVDLDGMAPIERAIMKQVIPFYPFMRHLFRYLFALPVDHPYRAAILTRFSQQEQQEWNTLLPQMYMSYLFLGTPDKNGNVVGIDTKNINPFRSFYNDFTLAGFVSAANPFATGLLTGLGVNVLSASPDLFTNWTYNPTTGGRTGSRPGNLFTSMLETFIPETQAADSFLGLSSRFKNLRKTNPQAFQHDLFSYLNIPFATSKVNIPLTEERASIEQYQAAQAAATQAMSTGNWSAAERFDYVPYNGQMVDRKSLETYMKQLQSILARYGISDPKSVLRPSTAKHPFTL